MTKQKSSRKSIFEYDLIVLISLQRQLICNQTPRFTIGDCAAGHRVDNRDKNRNVLIVPRELTPVDVVQLRPLRPIL